MNQNNNENCMIQSLVDYNILYFFIIIFDSMDKNYSDFVRVNSYLLVQEEPVLQGSVSSVDPSHKLSHCLRLVRSP